MRAYYFGVPTEPASAIARVNTDRRNHALYPAEEMQGRIAIVRRIHVLYPVEDVQGVIAIVPSFKDATELATEMGWILARSIDELMNIWKGKQCAEWWRGYQENVLWE